MREAPSGFLSAVETILAALARDLSQPGFHVRLNPRARSVELRGTELAIPSAHARHWERFGNLPTALVHQAAYLAKRKDLIAAGIPADAVEADAIAYAERFLRDVVLDADEA